jgi:hypothetical protein
LLLPDRLLNPASSSLPHVADFNAIRHGWDLRDPQYLVFEDVVKKLVVELLESGEDEKLLTRLFVFFENMANSKDPNLSRDLLGIAILEPWFTKRRVSERLGDSWDPK